MPAWLARDHQYPFYKCDLMAKLRLSLEGPQGQLPLQGLTCPCLKVGPHGQVLPQGSMFPKVDPQGQLPPERYIITVLVNKVHSSFTSASEASLFNSDHFFFPHAQHACNPDEERCGTSALAAAFTIGQFIVKMSFWLLSFWAAWKRVCGAPLITAIAMSIALSGVIGAVRSSQHPCCPCKIVHPGLLKPVCDSTPIFISVFISYSYLYSYIMQN